MPPRREQQADALERKLTQIYEAFDSWNYKSAAKLAAAARQKHPDSHILMALQSVALWRSGRAEEALQVADDLLAAGPTEEQVLRTLTLVMRPAGQGSRLAAAWEAASSQQPRNQELLLGCFQSALGQFDFGKQQQLTLKLQKLAPSEKYQWWLVDLLVLQARAAAAGAASVMGQDKLLQLAASMGARLLQAAAAAAGKEAGGSREALMLHLGVVIAQGKYENALQLLATPAAAAALPMAAELREAHAAVLQLAGKANEAAELYRATLTDQPDDWNAALLYLDCKVPGGTPGINYSSCMAVARELQGPGRAWAAPVSEVEADDAAWEEVADTITSLSSAPPSSTTNGATATASSSSSSSSSSRRPVLRGPQLAQVELCLRQLQAGRGTAEDLAGAVLEYYDKLGHTLSCAKDVQGYLPHLGPGAAAWLGAALQVKVTTALTSGIALGTNSTAGSAAAVAATGAGQAADGSGSSRAAVQLDQLRRQVAALQIQEAIGLPVHKSANEAAAHAGQLMALFAKQVHLYEGLDSRERGPADELLSLAAASLVAAHRLHHHTSAASPQQLQQASPAPEDLRYILQAVVLLEAGVKLRPYSAPLRLGAAWLYGCLGCVPAVSRHFQALDCKHIQMDTVVSHLLLPLLLGLGAGEGARKELKRTLVLFRDHLQDAGETLYKAYEHGTHTKVLEFVAFKERLERSHTYATAQAELACLDITQPASGTSANTGSSSSKEEHTAGAAAAAAASSCPLGHLESLSWQGMRYNADLAARLSWQAPVEGRPGGGVLAWWQQQRQAPLGATEAADGCWWQGVSAAEADTAPAAAYRAALKAAAEGRWLLPHLIAAALGVAPPPSATTSSSSTAGATPAAASSGDGSSEEAGGAPAAPLLPHEHLQHLLPRYMAACGLTATPAGAVAGGSAAAAAAAAAGASGGSSSTVEAMGQGLQQQLDMIGATMFVLGAAVQELLHLLGQEATTLQVLASTSHSIQQAATRLGQQLSVLQLQLLPLLRPAPAAAAASTAAAAGCAAVVLTGEVLSGLALLLRETGLLLVVCLEAWCSSWRGMKKKNKGKKATPGQQLLKEPVVDSSIHSLTVLQQHLTELLTSVAGSGRQVLLVPAGEQVQALLCGMNGGAGVEGLVGWQKGVVVQTVLSDMEQQQRGLLQECVDAAEQLQQRLGTLSW